MDGIISFLEEIDIIKRHKAIDIKYVVLTFLDGKVKKTAEIMDQMKDHLGDRLSVLIRYSFKLSESPAWSKLYLNMLRGHRWLLITQIL